MKEQTYSSPSSITALNFEELDLIIEELDKIQEKSEEDQKKFIELLSRFVSKTFKAKCYTSTLLEKGTVIIGTGNKENCTFKFFNKQK